MVLEKIDERQICRKCGKKDILSDDGRCAECWDKDADKEFDMNMKCCPHCGSSNLQKRGFDGGVQMYRCKSCNKKFREHTTRIEHIGIKCPNCGSTNTTKKGFDNNIQIHNCKSCNRRFRETVCSK